MIILLTTEQGPRMVVHATHLKQSLTIISIQTNVGCINKYNLLSIIYFII